MMRTGETFEVTKTEEEWRKQLTPEQYHVLREHGTERPGTCALLHEKRPGTFSCVALRPTSVQVAAEVRERHRLAKFLRADSGRGREHRPTAAIS